MQPRYWQELTPLRRGASVALIGNNETENPMNPFLSPARRLFLIAVGPVAGVITALVLYLPAVAAAVADSKPPVVFEEGAR